MSGTQQQLAKALSLHQQGNLIDAAKLYQQVLEAEPQNVDALNLLGLIYQAAGEFESAITLIGQACALAPDYYAPAVNLGNVYQEAGRLDEAMDTFRMAITINPESAAAYNNLASCLNDKDLHEDALAACVDGLKRDAGMGDLHVNMGNALLGLGKAEESLKSFEKAIKFGGQNNPNAWFNMGNALGDLDRYEEACTAFAKAIALEDGNPQMLYNYANALQQEYRFAEAVPLFERAIERLPGYVDAYCNLASAYQSLGNAPKAVNLLRQALKDEPDSVDLHWNLSLALLQSGQYQEGWAEYEWRWETPTFADFRREFDKPQWDGGDLDGQTILIHAEQGFGDGVQFIRYAPLVAAKGGRVIVECRAQLNRLFTSLDGVAQVIDLGADLPEYDVHAPVMSLPFLFKTAVDTIPAAIPYLKVPSETALAPEDLNGEGLKVGLVWAGSPTRRDNLKRSCPMAALADLISIPGATFYSLQVGPFEAQLDELPEDAKVVNLAPNLKDFADTAAALDSMDVLVSVDTGVLHLAGALGKPVLAMMSQPTGFLWMDERTDSPWYPTARLFRQQTIGEWGDVIDGVKGALADMIAKSAGA